MKYYFITIASIFTLLNPPLYATENTKSVYTIAFVPQHSPRKIIKIWGPVVKALSKKTGIKLKLRVDKSIPDFEKKLDQAQYDFVYMNPYHYTIFHKNGYNAFAKAKNKKIQGIFVTKVGNNIKTLADFANQSICFPSPNAFAATILTQSALKNANIKYSVNYVLSHDSVYGNVEQGTFSAGGGIKRTFKVFNSENPANDLHIVWQSKKYTPHAFASNSKVPKNVADKISRALLSLPLELLKAPKIKEGFISAVDSDWDDVRALRITRK